MGLHMAETESLKTVGTQREKSTLKEGNILLLDSDWHQVCASEENELKKMYSSMF
jgi:hypothetical protein